MNFVTWSIRNPVPVIVIFVALTVAGLLSFPKLGVQDQPDIELPAVIVTVGYPGVPPSQLESEVTRKVEDAVSSIVGIEHINSSINEGSSTTSISFQFGRDISEAVDDVRDAVTRIRTDLPADAREPVISRVTTAGRPVLTFSVESENMTDTELSWFVDLTVMREITSAKGVGSVRRVGGVTREIRVDVDPDRMASLGATASDISRQLRRIQAEYPGGSGRVGGLEQSVRTTGTIGSAQELAALPIVLSDGRTVRLDTIAEIRDQAAERRQIALLDGKPVIGFEVVRAWGASALDVADESRAAVERLSKQYPSVKFKEVSSTVDFIRASYVSSMEMLFEGALLAVIVVWVFLRDWRATFISAAALPLAIIPTFWAMHLLGYTLNILTLLALSLVVGMLVDDAIVEVENIVRHLRQGKKPFEASMDAAIEIGLAVVATTLTLCAVFVPVAFMGGIPGEFFRPFAFTAAVAVLFSLLVARMLTPMMAAYMLKAHPEQDETSRMKQRYLETVEWCLHHRGKTLGIATALLIGCFALTPFIPTGFAPAGDVGFAVLSVELPPGATIEETRNVAETIRNRVNKMPEVVSVYSIIGSAAGGGGPGGPGDSVGDVRRASLTIMLTPADDRDITQQEFQMAAARKLSDIPGVRLSFGAQTGSKLQITLAGDDPLQLNLAASTVERDLRTLPGIGNVTSSASLLKPEIVIRPLADRAAELGVTTDTLSTVTRIATSGDVENSLAKLNLASRQIPIRVQLPDDARGDLDRIRLLPVPSRNGTVPLMSVAEVSLGAGPARITRYDSSRNVTVEADLNGLPLGDMLNKANKLPALVNLPAGVTQVAAGEAEFMIELFRGFGQAMVVGILCVYLLLVMLFREFLQPLTILSALPPSAGGALLFLFVFNYQMSIPSLIGMLMLMGIVTKNSILLVEYAVRAMHEGMSRFDAMMDACAKRARPIVMTTIAMGAGMLPIATGWSGDPSFRAPMGVAVIGGLLASTALSLFVVPVLFLLTDELQQKLRRAFSRKEKPAQPQIDSA
ncbi:MAG TPA: efflux RND transporter permease subunit [Steroidobacteraceae bacterium]|nr:efflux RND transporter permease subunit [Steroidobacteraceae bacterium]